MVCWNASKPGVCGLPRSLEVHDWFWLTLAKVTDRGTYASNRLWMFAMFRGTRMVQSPFRSGHIAAKSKSMTSRSSSLQKHHEGLNSSLCPGP